MQPSLVSPPVSTLDQRELQSTPVPGSTASPPPIEDQAGQQQPKVLPQNYIWQIRKWLRKDLEQKELVFRDIGIQWRRQSKHVDANRKSEAFRRSVAMQRVASSASSSGGDPARATSDLLHPLVYKRSDPSMSSRTSIGLERSEAAENSTADDEEHDSDPEDSERPWLCDLILPTLPLSASARTLRRVRLGTLKPAPHHPRLVGQLNVPLSLAPLSLGLDVTVCDSDGTEHEATAFISVEEMKDLLCVTALWLVVNQTWEA